MSSILFYLDVEDSDLSLQMSVSKITSSAVYIRPDMNFNLGFSYKTTKVRLNVGFIGIYGHTDFSGLTQFNCHIIILRLRPHACDESYISAHA